MMRNNLRGHVESGSEDEDDEDMDDSPVLKSMAKEAYREDTMLKAIAQ